MNVYRTRVPIGLKKSLILFHNFTVQDCHTREFHYPISTIEARGFGVDNGDSGFVGRRSHHLTID